ncbi:MAG: D-2-hydroxyacid dehydrogenase [Clostridia bacterium]|nr:D-2-hydroxyacid dehydrogenase [Clostridia bacterium]
MKIIVLDKATIGDDLDLSPLSALGELTVYDATSREEVGARIQQAQIVLLNKVRLDATVLQQAPSLRLICVFATGYDNIDLSYARAHGIAVCNVPAYSTESVTLFTVSTALSLFTHLSEYRTFVASGAYSQSGAPNRLTPVYHELQGKTWGIVGGGHIGTRVGEVAQALGARVLIHQRHPHPSFPTVDLATLCRESDVLSLHCPLTEATRGMIGREQLSLMKPSAVLVNEARGAVVDEAAVADAITQGQIGAYGCDVYSTEPFTTEHPFYAIKDLPNVLLTPHTAWGAYEARARCVSVVADNIRAFLSGRLHNRVD